MQEIVKDVAFLDNDEGILVIDDKNRLIEFNDACRGILDWLDLSRLGMDLTEFPEGKKILGHIGTSFEMKLTRNGVERFYEFRKAPLLDQDKKLGSVYFIKDISEQKEMIRQSYDVTDYDPLTGLYNRKALMAELEREIRRLLQYGRCMSVLMIDIDNLCQIKEQYGSNAGDKALTALAATCRDRLRKTDLVGRYDGGVFLAVLPEANEENALNIAESIRKSIADLSFLSNGSVMRITVSIGIKTVHSHDEDLSAEHILDGASRALVNAKSCSNRASAVTDTV